MRRFPSALAVLAALACAVPAQAQRDKKDKKTGTIVDAEDALKPGVLVGKLDRVADNSIVVRTDIERLELRDKNGGRNASRQQLQLIRRQQQLERARRELARARKPQDQLREMREYQRQVARIQQDAARTAARGQANLFKVVKDHKDYLIELDEDAKVQALFPPLDYDDKGEPKKYTDAELKELAVKGTKPPRYKASTEALRSGQKVTVTLAKNKETGGELRGVLVVITEESDEPLDKGKGRKKPKK
jgi:hypothetical protein